MLGLLTKICNIVYERPAQSRTQAVVKQNAAFNDYNQKKLNIIHYRGQWMVKTLLAIITI